MMWVCSSRERQKVLQAHPCPGAGLEGAGDGVAGTLLCSGEREMQRCWGGSRRIATVHVCVHWAVSR